MFTRLFAKCVEDGTIDFVAVKHPKKEGVYGVLAVYPTTMEVIGTSDFYNTCSALKSFSSCPASAIDEAMEKFRTASKNPKDIK